MLSADDAPGVEGATSAEAPPRPAVRPAGSGQRALSILVAEDMPVNQALMRALLTNEGHQVKIAGNGVEAVEAAAKKTYDVIFMDVQMPVMDGLQATRAIRKLPGHAATPIVAMTADTYAGDHDRFTAAGMSLGKVAGTDARRSGPLLSA